MTQRTTTGLPQLDKLLEGGFPSNSVILVSGGPGAGKTLFGLNFLLEGALNKEKCAFVSLGEESGELVRACEGIESLSQAKNFLGKNLVFQRQEMGPAFRTDKFTALFVDYPKIDRLVIDNVNRLFFFDENTREYRRHLYELTKRLRLRAGCTLLLCETKNNSIDSGFGESYEADGVVNLSFLELEEKPKRILTVHKMRYTSFDAKLPREFVISRKGLKLGERKFV